MLSGLIDWSLSNRAMVVALFILMALLWVFRSGFNLESVTIPGWSKLFAQPRRPFARFSAAWAKSALMLSTLSQISAGRRRCCPRSSRAYNA